jgi:hypothetical protein
LVLLGAPNVRIIRKKNCQLEKLFERGSQPALFFKKKKMVPYPLTCAFLADERAPPVVGSGLEEKGNTSDIITCIKLKCDNTSDMYLQVFPKKIGSVAY